MPWLSCTGERAVQPSTDHWVVYAAGWGLSQIYVLDADSLSIVDSIPFNELPSAIIPSPDGNLLYIMTDGWDGSPAATYIVDSKTGEKISTVEELTGLPHLARSGSVLVRARAGVDRAYLCDPLTYAISDSLEDGLLVRDVLNCGDTLLAEFRNSASFKLYDLKTNRVSGYYRVGSIRPDSTPGPYTWRVRVTPTGHRVVALTDNGIEIGDLDTGEKLSTETSHGQGWVDVSSDGHYAAVATSFGWSSKFWLFDVAASPPTKLRKLTGYADSLICGGWPGFLPDGERVLIGAYPGIDSGPLQVFDMASLRITQWIRLPGEDGDVRCYAIARAPQ